MRKLAAAEVALLISAMAVGSALADDSCEMTGQLCNYPLETVNVNGFYSPTSVSGAVPQNYILPNGNLLSSAGYDGVVRVSTVPLPTPAQQAKVKSCVAAYGKYGVNPSYPIVYKQFFTYMLPGSNIKLSAPQATQPNSGDIWYGVAGVTVSAHIIYLYEQGWGGNVFASSKDLFDTLAHEESHAFGVTDETQAEADAQQAYQAYASDGGKKCGGPM
jgi:hypothetical protein